MTCWIRFTFSVFDVNHPVHRAERAWTKATEYREVDIFFYVWKMLLSGVCISHISLEKKRPGEGGRRERDWLMD